MLLLKENSVQEIDTNELIFKEEINIINNKIEDFKKSLINSNTKFDKTCSTFDISTKSVVNNIRNDDFLLNEVNSLRQEIISKEEELKSVSSDLNFKIKKIAQLETDLKEKVSQYEEKIFFLANEIKNMSNVINHYNHRKPTKMLSSNRRIKVKQNLATD
jgi:predicted  nucleic acid-binding Zn-ribbon protein